MHTVWKYEWPLAAQLYRVSWEMPQGAQILCAREQGFVDDAKLCIWALVDPSRPKEERWFNIVGTGHAAPEGRYIGTAMLMGGRLVLHVFEDEKLP